LVFDIEVVNTTGSAMVTLPFFVSLQASVTVTKNVPADNPDIAEEVAKVDHR
jgi:hypothetical protein